MSEHELLSRLYQMRKHLRVRLRPEDVRFDDEAIAMATKRAYDMLSQEHFKTGEEIAEFLAQKLAVKIEDVRSPEDVQRVQKKYLERGEISFGQIEIEFRNSDIDAVTIKRENASDDANDKYVAVLNHQEDGARAYFSIKHELVHCFAEPPQRDLFHRHREAKKNRLEAIVDAVAAKIAFYEPVFAPLVASYEGTRYPGIPSMRSMGYLLKLLVVCRSLSGQ